MDLVKMAKIVAAMNKAVPLILMEKGVFTREEYQDKIVELSGLSKDEISAAVNEAQEQI